MNEPTLTDVEQVGPFTTLQIEEAAVTKDCIYEFLGRTAVYPVGSLLRAKEGLTKAILLESDDVENKEVVAFFHAAIDLLTKRIEEETR